MEAKDSKVEIVENKAISWIFIQVIEGRHYIGVDLMYKVKDLEQNETHVEFVTIDPDMEENYEEEENDEGSDLLFESFEDAILHVFTCNEELERFIRGDDDEMSMTEFSRRLDAFCTCHWVSDDRIVFVRGE